MSFQTDAGSRRPAAAASSGVTPSIPAARSATATLTPPAQRGTGLTWDEPSGEVRAVFSRPGMPEPRLRQLMGVCGWAAVLGGIGLIIAIRGIFGVITGEPPGWYEPATTAVGLTGIAFTVAAFISVQRRRLPWALLAVASVFLVTAMFFTASAL